MPKYNPSQFDCDNMEQGDMIYIRKRSFLYKWYRKHFIKPLQIKFKTEWREHAPYTTQYQEDCILIYRYEASCIQDLDNIVPAFVSKDIGSVPYKRIVFKHFKVGINNIVLTLPDNTTLTFPVDAIAQSIEKNDKLLKSISDQRLIQEQLKFQRYKGNYFKNYVADNKIEQWQPSYCSICGKPIVFKFDENGANVETECECGNVNVDRKFLSYDELSIWYASQPEDIAKKRYKKFWFKEV